MRFDAIVIFGLAPTSSTVTIIEMAYIISRNNRFYVVAYDGVDPVTGRERRRWHAAGSSRADAEAIASSITETNRVPIPRGRDAVTLGDYLTNTWLPERQRRVRATTAYRYGWIDRAIHRPDRRPVCAQVDPHRTPQRLLHDAHRDRRPTLRRARRQDRPRSPSHRA